MDEKNIIGTNNRELCRATLSEDSFLIINRKVVRAIGLEAAWFLSFLIYKEHLFEKDNKLTKEGMFFYTQQNIKEDICLPAHKQTESLNLLKERKLLEVKKKGLPARNYFKINYDQLTEILANVDFDKSKRSFLTTEKDAKSYINKEIINKKNIKLLSKDNNSDSTNRSKDDPFHLYLEEAKELFEFWNSLPNLPHHRAAPTKKFKQILQTLEIQINRFASHKMLIDDIYSAMYRYDQLFEKNRQGQTKYRISCGKKSMLGHHVGLDEFFKFNEFTTSNVKSRNNNPFVERLILENKSWFDECCMGQDYLIQTYGIEETRVHKIDSRPKITSKEEDEYRHISERLEKEWNEHGFRELSENDKKSIAIASMIFAKFDAFNGNKIHWQGTCDNQGAKAAWLIEAINHAGKGYAADPTWLYSKKTYDEYLPKYIKDSGDGLLLSDLIPYDKWKNTPMNKKSQRPPSTSTIRRDAIILDGISENRDIIETEGYERLRAGPWDMDGEDE